MVHLSNFSIDEVEHIEGFDHEKGKVILKKVYPFEVSVCEKE